MAIATSTALAIGSLAVTAGSAGMSFAQARQQKKLGEEAKKDAENAMASARRALEVNFYDQLAVQKEPYELERESLLAQGAQSVQAGVEGASRGAAATAGRVQMAMNEAQAGQRTAMGKEMSDLEKLSAQEDARLRDVGVQLDLAEVEGAQQAQADAAQARAAAISQGMQQVGSAVQQGIGLVPLYQQNMDAQKAAVQKSIGDKSIGDIGMQQYNGQTIGLMDFQKMSNAEWRQFKNFLSPEQSNQLFQSDAYLKNYNPNPFQIY
jgi:hypothetical protein